MKKATKKVDNSADPFYSCMGPEEIKAKFKELAKEAHPDRGGSHERFVALVEARDRALDEEDILDMLGE